jgi:hypothetical protein
MKNGLKKDYYLSCDELPIYNWQKCLDGNLTYLRKNEEGSEDNDNLAWWDFLNDYYDVIGFSDQQLQLNELKERYLMALLDYLEAPENQQAFLSNELTWSKDALDFFTKNKEQNQEVKSSILTSVVDLQDIFKYQINEYKTTVLKFHIMMKKAEKLTQNG